MERVQSQCPQTQIVSVGDCEADVYELFVWATQKSGRPQLLVRAEDNRRVQDEHGYLWEQMAAQPLAGIKEVRLPRRANRAARTAQLEGRFGAVELRSPKHRGKMPKVRLWVTQLGRETPDVPCTVYFEEIEWPALVGFIRKDSIPPPRPPSLREAIRMVASLGGCLGRKGEGEPGTHTLWLGLQRLDDISEAGKVLSQMVNHTASSNRTYG